MTFIRAAGGNTRVGCSALQEKKKIDSRIGRREIDLCGLFHLVVFNNVTPCRIDALSYPS